MASISTGLTGDYSAGGVNLAEGAGCSSGFYLYGRVFEDFSSVQDLYASEKETDPLSPAYRIIVEIMLSLVLSALIIMLVTSI